MIRTIVECEHCGVQKDVSIGLFGQVIEFPTDWVKIVVNGEYEHFCSVSCMLYEKGNVKHEANREV